MPNARKGRSTGEKKLHLLARPSTRPRLKPVPPGRSSSFLRLTPCDIPKKQCHTNETTNPLAPTLFIRSGTSSLRRTSRSSPAQRDRRSGNSAALELTGGAFDFSDAAAVAVAAVERELLVQPKVGQPISRHSRGAAASEYSDRSTSRSSSLTNPIRVYTGNSLAPAS